MTDQELIRALRSDLNRCRVRAKAAERLHREAIAIREEFDALRARIAILEAQRAELVAFRTAVIQGVWATLDTATKILDESR